MASASGYTVALTGATGYVIEARAELADGPDGMIQAGCRRRHRTDRRQDHQQRGHGRSRRSR